MNIFYWPWSSFFYGLRSKFATHSTIITLFADRFAIYFKGIPVFLMIIAPLSHSNRLRGCDKICAINIPQIFQYFGTQVCIPYQGVQGLSLLDFTSLSASIVIKSTILGLGLHVCILIFWFLSHCRCLVWLLTSRLFTKGICIIVVQPYPKSVRLFSIATQWNFLYLHRHMWCPLTSPQIVDIMAQQ